MSRRCSRARPPRCSGAVSDRGGGSLELLHRNILLRGDPPAPAHTDCVCLLLPRCACTCELCSLPRVSCACDQKNVYCGATATVATYLERQERDHSAANRKTNQIKNKPAEKRRKLKAPTPLQGTIPPQGCTRQLRASHEHVCHWSARSASMSPKRSTALMPTATTLGGGPSGSTRRP